MREEMLARLIAQAEAEGSDLVTLRAVVEEACDLGAARVLERMGLADETAHADLIELRQLLQAWRDAKTSAWQWWTGPSARCWPCCWWASRCGLACGT